jgi:hypothetical protein
MNGPRVPRRHAEIGYTGPNTCPHTLLLPLVQVLARAAAEAEHQRRKDLPNREGQND